MGMVGLCSGILSGAAVTAIRVARRTEGNWAIFASFFVVGVLASAPFALWQWKTPNAREMDAHSGFGTALDRSADIDDRGLSVGRKR